MPVNVPSEPKKHTTIYDGFKGVDYTNDASNAFRRRTPSGKNMLPDLDGRPHKRPGWEIKIKASDFVRAAIADYDATKTYDEGDYAFYDGVLYQCNTTISVAEAWDSDHWDEATIDVIPNRTHYFNYGSYDFLMIFNSLGVFYMRDDQNTVTLCEMWDETLTPPAAAPFPPTKTIKVDGTDESVVVPADANRAFFFEGQGIAGFYVFVENDLYRFGVDDNGDLYFFKVKPTIPVVLIGANPQTGAGTDNQSVNMLTDYRTVEYFGDGTTRQYELLQAVSKKTEVSVQILNSVGEWKDQPSGSGTYQWDITDGTNTLEFTSAPPFSTVGNVRITYRPATGTSYILTTGIETNKVTASATKTEVYEETETIIDTYRRIHYSPWTAYSTETSSSGWSLKSRAYDSPPVSLSLPGIFKPTTLDVKADYTGSYASQTSITKDFGAYNTGVSVSFLPIVDTIASTYGATTESVSAWVNVSTSETTYTSGATTFRKVTTVRKRSKTVKKSKSFTVYGTYTQAETIEPNPALGARRDAFANCQKVLGFGNNLYNQMFISASSVKDFHNTVWYSAANDPTYFPDTNYIEVGSDDKPVMGMLKVGSYLGIVKRGSGTEASIYLAYATSFDEESTYAVKQSVSGIGAISTGAFNVLNEEPLFLSERGVMGINVAEDDLGKQVRNRSYFINGKLTKEERIQNAISFVHEGMYYLAVNNHCYVLDGSQKSSWANEKTNLQYECYYLENIPAQCFAKMKGTLYFSDFKGNVCRVKSADEQFAYIDDYAESAQWIANAPPVNGKYDITELAGTSGEEAWLMTDDGDYLHDITDDRLTVLVGLADFNQTVRYGDDFYTVQSLEKNLLDGKTYASVLPGVPIKAVWSTIADDDGMVHFFKNLAKKGFVISILPETLSGVGVYVKPDEKEPIFLGNIDVGKTTLPYDIFGRKKVKKYKRLQIICENGVYNDGFALDQIVKTYTLGNYSKNRK